MVDVWRGTTEEGCWAPCFVRSPKDWELREVERFLCMLQRRGVHNWGKERNFSVKQLQRRSGWWMFGVVLLRRDVGLLVLLKP